jgi:HlyD family secretion protein
MDEAATLSPKYRSIRRYLFAGVSACVVLVVGVGGWAATAELSGAVVAPGSLVVDTFVKKVQHPTGGIVGELFVREGDRVKADDLLIKLDETVTRANLQIILGNLDENTARQARLEAERDEAAEIVFPAELLARIDDPKIGRLVAGEKKFFELRRTTAEGQKSQLRQRVEQLKQETEGLQSQLKSKVEEISLVEQELVGVTELWQKNLVQINRVMTLRRDAARITGEKGALIGNIAQTGGKITETELQILQVDQQFRSDVAKELADVRGKVTELLERRVAAEDQLKRVDIRAPQDGIVHQLNVHTVGGVIAQGEPIMLIVPQSDELMVEAKIPPQEIDQIHLGQEAMLRFSAFNQRTTPEVKGEVTRVSADVVVDQKTNASYYTIRIGFSDEEAKRLGNVRLVAGMPVEAFVKTQPRSVMSYLVRPLHDQVMRAFREK